MPKSSFEKQYKSYLDENKFESPKRLKNGIIGDKICPKDHEGKDYFCGFVTSFLL